MKIALTVFVTLAFIAIVQVQAAPLAEDDETLAAYGADLVDVYCGPKDNGASDDSGTDDSGKTAASKGKKNYKNSKKGPNQGSTKGKQGKKGQSKKNKNKDNDAQ